MYGALTPGFLAYAVASGMTGGVLGALPAFAPSFAKRKESGGRAALSFAGGLMLALVLFEILPASFEMSSRLRIFASLLSGILLAAAITITTDTAGTDGKVSRGPHSKTRAVTFIRRASFTIFILMTLHNLPEGMALGSGYHVSAGAASVLSLSIIIHDIPEGLAVALLLRKEGIRPLKAFLITASSGLATVAGCVFASLFGAASPDVLGPLLAFAGGAMLFVTLSELLPGQRSFPSTAAALAGIILAVVLSVFL